LQPECLLRAKSRHRGANCDVRFSSELTSSTVRLELGYPHRPSGHIALRPYRAAATKVLFSAFGEANLPLICVETDWLGLPMENPINHRNLEGTVVELVNGSAIAQAKQTRSGFDPFEGRLLRPFLILKNSVFLSVIVNEFKFVYLVGFSVFHSPSPLAIV
jgi:hypothetical protein